jgi:hypothetical protein
MTSEPVEAQQMSESNHSPELISPRHLSERRATSGDMSVSNLRTSNSQRASVTRQIESVKLSPGQIDLYFHM